MPGHYRAKSNEKLTKYEIRSSYCFIQFGVVMILMKNVQAGGQYNRIFEPISGGGPVFMNY